MALTLIDSLLACNEYNKTDVACSYAYWMWTRPLCAGRTTRKALNCGKKFIKKPTFLGVTYNFPVEWRESMTEKEKNWLAFKIKSDVFVNNSSSLSNGALMRIAPLALKYYKQPALLSKYAREDASITHVNENVLIASDLYVTALAVFLDLEKRNMVSEKKKTKKNFRENYNFYMK